MHNKQTKDNETNNHKSVKSTTDIVISGKNPQLADMAVRCGYSHLILIHSSLEEFYSATIPRVPHLKISHGLIIEEKEKRLIFQKIRAAQKEGCIPFIEAQSPQFNRFIVEKAENIVLFNVEYTHKDDHMHFRRGGLDQVVCKFASKNNITIVSSFSKLNVLNPIDQSKVIGRIKQNIRFCQKYKTKYGLFTFADDSVDMRGAHDLATLMKRLGMKKIIPIF